MAAASDIFAADSPHFTIRFFILASMDSFAKVLTAPDDTRSSERAAICAGTCG
jgi:hypothetical protein